MSTHLKAQNLWSSIDPGLSEGDVANSQRRDQLVLEQIHQGVDYSIFGMIANAKTTKVAWDILKLTYKGVDRAQKSKLQSLTESVEQYFSRLTDLVNKMRLYGDKIGDNVIVEKILRTIPLKYDHVVASIQESHDIEPLTIAKLKSMIESHIDRIEAKMETPANEEALKKKSMVIPDIPNDFLDEQPTQDNIQVSEQSEAPTRRSQRERRFPARLQDYILSNDNDLSDEEIVQFSLFADCDPISFEDAAKKTHWFRMECSKPVPTAVIEKIKLSKDETGLWRNQKNHIGLQQCEFSDMSKIVEMLRLERVHEDMLFI
ncbi:hypothetical protein ZIOFF_008299 [Zingiber officinale]|uniref:Gag-pol polyprotein n=1 Tax=Zingiber officinale TaxID=94328 RepID=A0A8J5HVZ0_ZINOF|nr:hypothetical protein ZIOFF_008299 [Zingiber officinale]